MATYAEVSCRYLVQALNEIGSLGLVTQHLLLLQDKAVGVALTQPNNKQSLRQTSHYHLARQLVTLQSSGLQLTFPQGQASLSGNALSKTLSKIHYGPQDLGLACKVPVEVFRPLMDIVNNMTQLCGRSAHRHVMLMLSTDELKLKYGNIVRKEHKVALNQLTKILNRDQTDADITGPTFKHSAALSKNERVIKRPEILSDLTGQSTEHVQSQNMNAVECSALQLLQQYHHEVSNQKTCVTSKRKRGTPQRCEVHTDGFSRTHHNSAGTRAGHPPETKIGHCLKLRDTANTCKLDQLQHSHSADPLGKFRIGQRRCQSSCTQRNARATRTAHAQGCRQHHTLALQRLCGASGFFEVFAHVCISITLFAVLHIYNVRFERFLHLIGLTASTCKCSSGC